MLLYISGNNLNLIIFIRNHSFKGWLFFYCNFLHFMLYMYNVCGGGEFMIAIRVSKEIEDRLALLAERTGRTKTYYARHAILEYLDDMEDIYLASKVLENHNQEIYSQEEVEQMIELENSMGKRRH